MAAIQIEVSPELAERLQRYQHALPRLLEKAVSELEQDEADQAPTEALQDSFVKEQIREVLREAGAVGPSTEAMLRHLRERTGQAWEPLPSRGQPSSEMIIDERKSRSWEEA